MPVKTGNGREMLALGGRLFGNCWWQNLLRLLCEVRIVQFLCCFEIWKYVSAAEAKQACFFTIGLLVSAPWGAVEPPVLFSASTRSARRLRQATGRAERGVSGEAAPWGLEPFTLECWDYTYVVLCPRF